MKAPGSGSRARSREIGYGEGMLEMSRVLLRMRRDLEAVAQLDDTEPVERLELLAMARAYKRAENYAFATWEMTACSRDGAFARDVEHLAFLEREYNGRPAPRELPQREQSENN